MYKAFWRLSYSVIPAEVLTEDGVGATFFLFPFNKEGIKAQRG